MVARCFARDVTLYDGGRAVRTFYTLMQPYSVAFLPQKLGGGAGAPGQLISLTEGHLVSGFAAAPMCACHWLLMVVSSRAVVPRLIT